MQESGADIRPSDDLVRDAKYKCRPEAKYVSIVEGKAEVELQALLNHTAQRIISMQSNVILHINESIPANNNNLEVIKICSYGFDGSTGYSAYNQAFHDGSGGDESLFATTLIPLRIILKGSGIIVWNNTSSQLHRFCRPKKLRFVKESKEVILAENAQLKREISGLSREIFVENVKVTTASQLCLTLIDEKVLYILTDTKSMQTCPICHKNPKDFRSTENIRAGIFKPIEGTMKFGISPLHAWIRLFELCLQISYRLSIKKHQMRSETDKHTF